MQYHYLIVGLALLISTESCNPTDTTTEIIITNDPFNLNNSQEIHNISNSDSIKFFMDIFNSKRSKIYKFFPTYSIDIIKKGHHEYYLGNANHVKDSTGRTYQIEDKRWDINAYFRYK